MEVSVDLSPRREGRMRSSGLSPFVYRESRLVEGMFTPPSASPRSQDVANSCLHVNLFILLFSMLPVTPPPTAIRTFSSGELVPTHPYLIPSSFQPLYL